MQTLTKIATIHALTLWQHKFMSLYSLVLCIAEFIRLEMLFLVMLALSNSVRNTFSHTWQNARNCSEGTIREPKSDVDVSYALWWMNMRAWSTKVVSGRSRTSLHMWPVLRSVHVGWWIYGRCDLRCKQVCSLLGDQVTCCKIQCSVVPYCDGR